MVESIEDLGGLSRSHPGLAVALTALVLSVAGIPPLAGFLGKFWVFAPAVEAGQIWLVVVAVLASVVSAFYYLRIVKIVWMQPVEQPLSTAPRELGLIASGAALAVFPLMVLPVVFPKGLEAIAAAANALF